MKADPPSGRGASEALREVCVPPDMVDVDGDAEIRGRRGLAHRQRPAHGEEAGQVATECRVERPRGRRRGRSAAAQGWPSSSAPGMNAGENSLARRDTTGICYRYLRILYSTFYGFFAIYGSAYWEEIGF